MNFRLFCLDVYSISSKGFFPTVIDIMVIWVKFTQSTLVHWILKCQCSFLPSPVLPYTIYCDWWAGVIPGPGRSAEEGIGYPFQYSWASLVAQLVKKLPACNVRAGFNPWVGNMPWRRERLPTPVFWPGESHGLSMRSQKIGHDWVTFTLIF